MSDKYKKLDGGNLTNIYKLNDTVIRSQGRYSPTVHRLLLHLEKEGFNRCPRFLEIDENNNEILSFVEGDSLSDYPMSDNKELHRNLIKELAKLLRCFHDASASFVTSKEDIWMLSYDGLLEKEVICHNDIAPYNMTFINNLPYGIIDFDTCCPAPRIWDIVYALYRFIPFMDSTISDEYKALCISIFFDIYQLRKPDNLFEIMVDRLQALADLILIEANNGNISFIRMLKEGHRDLYLKDIEYIKLNAHLWM